MKPVKYSSSDVGNTDLGTKIIHKYPTPSKNYDIARMEVKGRFPKGNSFIINNVCDFFIYVLVGIGKVYAGDEIFDVKPRDVVFVPAKNKYAVDGKFEYITIDVPDGTEKLFDRGLVDDEVLSPTCHFADISAGGLLVFRAKGRNLLAHSFRSQTQDRRSVVNLFSHEPSSASQ